MDKIKNNNKDYPLAGEEQTLPPKGCGDINKCDCCTCTNKHISLWDIANSEAGTDNIRPIDATQLWNHPSVTAELAEDSLDSTLAANRGCQVDQDKALRRYNSNFIDKDEAD